VRYELNHPRITRADYSCCDAQLAGEHKGGIRRPLLRRAEDNGPSSLSCMSGKQTGARPPSVIGSRVENHSRSNPTLNLFQYLHSKKICSVLQ
jgi:hypothetical protein